MFKEEFQKNKLLCIENLAKHLVEKYYVISIYGHNTETYVYREGKYVEDPSVILADIQTELGEFTTKNLKAEVLSKINALTYKERQIFSVNPRYLNLANGVYDLETEQLLPHSPEFFFLHQLPIVFDPLAECPRIMEIFNDILDPDDLKLWLQWIGFCLYRKYFIKKALILTGEPDTGKTTIGTIIVKLLEKDINKSENISGISLQDLAKNKFAPSQLYQKHINWKDELTTADISDNSSFKVATGGGAITGEKKFGDSFVFLSHAKLIFACNQVPILKDFDDDAYYSRWLIINTRKRITSEKRIPMIWDKLNTQEYSGLLNLALAELKTLLTTGHFDWDYSPDEVKQMMLRSGSPLSCFIQDTFEEGTANDIVSKDDFYSLYEDYCSSRKLAKMTKLEVGKKITKICTWIKDSSHYIDKVKVNCWRNLRLKDGGVMENGSDTLVDVCSEFGISEEPISSDEYQRIADLP